MFKKAGGVKKNHVAVFGGGELDAGALKQARAVRDRDHHKDGEPSSFPAGGRRESADFPGVLREDSLPSLDGFAERGIASTLTPAISLLSFNALSPSEQAVIPEKVLRGIMFIVNGLGLSESYEAESLLDEVRKTLDRDFKKAEAQAHGGSISYARMRSTQRMEKSAMNKSQLTRSVSPTGGDDDDGTPTSSPATPTAAGMCNMNGTFGGVALRQSELDERQKQAQQDHRIDMMATFGRSVNFQLLDEGDKRFRSEEQKREDIHVAFFTRWSPFANLAIFFVQLYIVLAVLIRVGFEVPIPLHVFLIDKLVVDLPMLMKIFVSFYALHDDGSGVPKYRPKESARAYVHSGAFFIDVIGILPLDIIGFASGSTATLLTGREGFVAPQWNLNRLLQCRGMIDSFESVVEELMVRADVHPSAARLFHSSLVFLMAVHVVACMVFFLLYLYPTSFTEWFERPLLAEAALFDQYIAAFDWSSKNMVGMSRGSAFPSEELQMVAVVFVTALGVCIYGLLMANLSAYVERSTPESELQQTIDEVLDTAEYVGMPDSYTRDIIRYYEHASSARHHTQDVLEVVEDLPEDLGEEIIFTVGRDICKSVPLLADEADNQRFVLQLMDAMVPMMLLPGSIVFRRDDQGDSMYIVVSGELAVLSPADDRTVIAHLGPGSVVGEIALVADVPRTATVRADSERFTDCLTIDSDSFGSLLSQFPLAMESIEVKVADRLEELAARQEQQNRERLAAAAAGAHGNDGSIAEGRASDSLIVVQPAATGVPAALAGGGPLDTSLAGPPEVDASKPLLIDTSSPHAAEAAAARRQPRHQQPQPVTAPSANGVDKPTTTTAASDDPPEWSLEHVSEDEHELDSR